MKELKDTMDVVFILDRSGSMKGVESDTIGGYNGYLDSMRGKNALVTTILFDHEYKVLVDRVNIDNVPKLSKKNYKARGATALLDAIGKTIIHLDKLNPKKVLFIITTDGEENSSVEYNKSQIKELIEGHSNWEFIYLGADIDSYSEAGDIGIRQDRISNYSKKHTIGLFNKLKNLTCMFEADEIADDWKDGLEE